LVKLRSAVALGRKGKRRLQVAVAELNGKRHETA